MSVYFISTDDKKTEAAAAELEGLYDRPADIYRCGKISIAVSPAYRERYVMRVFGMDRILVIGTIFTTEGFGEEALAPFDTYESCVAAIKDREQRFFGHYVAICMDAGKKKTEIIQDRVGLINTYFSRTGEKGYCISNDILLVSRHSGNHSLCRQAVYEFALQEANAGSRTIFADVFRMKLGNGLFLTEDTMEEKAVYSYSIERMDVETYLQRIGDYFTCFNKYPKRVAADVSGGFDTRLVLSIAQKYVKGIRGFAARNRSDKGVDEELSGIITDRLHVDCYLMESYDKVTVGEREKELLLHGSSAMRDSDNSGKWGHLFRERYKQADLVLGGYGGEIMRAKYNRYSDVDDFIRQYYKGEEARKICKFEDFEEQIRQELDECVLAEGLSPDMVQNWYYGVVRMRIWGSGFIQMSDLYGDVVHPFMDWYLMNPIFGFSLKELEDARLQKYIIDFFAPELKDVPINCHMGAKPSFKANLKHMIHYHKPIRNAATLTYCRLRNFRENRAVRFEFGELPPCEEPIDWKRMQNKLGKGVASRTQSVIRAYRCVTRD